jgi:hypothetical protein
MKNILSILLITLFTLMSCSEDSEKVSSQTNITFNFSHTWDGIPVTSADFNDIKFINENGEQLNIELLRYLISRITFTSNNNEKLVLNGYNLVDVTNNQNLSFTSSTLIPQGTYRDLSFTFGFNNQDNSENYEDLNSASWSVPAMLGGGYHYMQMDGKFINNEDEEQGYNYHAIRAVDNPGDNPTFPQDTFFNVSLGEVTISNNTTFNIEMNIAEWFKNPNKWDLNVFNQVLMPNSEAQIEMYENGQNVFSLKSDD